MYISYDDFDLLLVTRDLALFLHCLNMGILWKWYSHFDLHTSDLLDTIEERQISLLAEQDHTFGLYP